MKRFLKILICALLIAAVAGILNFAIIPVNYNHIFKHQWKQQYTEVDTIVLGDSLPLRAVQPSVMDREMGVNAFNTATAQQDLCSTYYYLKDMIASCPSLKTVYLGLDYWNLVYEEPTVQGALIILDRLQTLRCKAELARHTLTLDAGWNVLFRFRNNMDSVYSVKDNVQKKLSPAYRRFEAVDGHDYNTDKGYAYTDSVGETLDVESKDLKELSEKSLHYYESILALCRDSGLKTVVFQTPCTREHLSQLQNYEYYSAVAAEIAQQYGARFYDFNSYPFRDQLDDDTCFKDVMHLNYTGSCIFMEWFCREFSDQ